MIYNLTKFTANQHLFEQRRQQQEAQISLTPHDASEDAALSNLVGLRRIVVEVKQILCAVVAKTVIGRRGSDVMRATSHTA